MSALSRPSCSVPVLLLLVVAACLLPAALAILLILVPALQGSHGASAAASIPARLVAVSALLIAVSPALAWLAGRRIAASQQAWAASATGQGDAPPPSGHPIGEMDAVAEALRRTSESLARRTAELHEAGQAIQAREESLRIANQRLAVALEAGETAVFTLDKDLRYTWVGGNQIGHDADKLVGKNDFDIFTRESAEMLQPFYRQVFETGVVMRRDVSVRSLAMPGEIHFHLVIQPWRDAQGAVSNLVCAAYNITRHRLAERALQEKEFRFRTTFDQAAVGIVHVAPDGRFVEVNDQFCAIVGYGREALLRQTMRSLTHPDDLAASLQLCRRLEAGEIPNYSLEKRYVRSDGTPVWVNVNVALVRSMDGEPEHFVGVVKNIQDRKEAEEQLRKLWLAVEQSPVSVVITDPGGHIEYVNPCFTRVTGYSAEEAVGQGSHLLKSGETPPEHYQVLWQTITAGGEWSGQMRNRKKNGDLFWAWVRIIPVLSGSGEVVNYLALKEDISERKEQEQLERVRQEQLLHNGRLITMGEMAAAMAHELNQPLTAIANFSSVIERKLAKGAPGAEEIRQISAMIAGQALRAGEIIQRTRGFVSKQEGASPLPADINDIIRDSMRLAEITLRAKSFPIALDLAAGLPPVAVERIQIEQVLFNLIKNGIEAMDGTCGEPCLAIRTRPAADGEVLVEVRDCGSGLPDAAAMDIFATFSTTKPKSMGMGLSICRSIIEAHGGRLWARNNPDAGATLAFTLPADRGGANG